MRGQAEMGAEAGIEKDTQASWLWFAKNLFATVM